MSVQPHEVREHMTVVGRDDGHVGTVDRVEGHRIKLTKQDDPDGSGQHHHFIPLADVQAVEGGRVRLATTASAARGAAISRGGTGRGTSEAASGVAEAAGQAFDAARDRVGAAARQAGDWAEEAYDSAGTMARSATASLSRTVEDQPVVTAIVAGAIGFALGALAVSYWHSEPSEPRRGHWARHGRERRNPDGGRVGSSRSTEGSAAYSSIPTG